MKETPGDIIILHMRTKNYHNMMNFPELWCGADGHTDRWTDGQKKWYIEMRAPSKKLWLQSENFSSSFFNILDI